MLDAIKVPQAAYEARNFQTELEALVGSKPGKTKAEKAAWDEAARKQVGAKFDALKRSGDIEKAANTLYKDAFLGLRDAPDNATDRHFMRQAALHAQKLLKKRGLEVTLADLQAALWYYEKRLYAHLGAKASDDIGYEEALRRLANEEEQADRHRPERGPVSGPQPDTTGRAAGDSADAAGAFAFWRRPREGVPGGARADAVLGRGLSGRRRVVGGLFQADGSPGPFLTGEQEVDLNTWATRYDYEERVAPLPPTVGRPARTLAEVAQAVVNSPYIERHQLLVVRDGVVVAHAVGTIGLVSAAYIPNAEAVRDAFKNGQVLPGDIVVAAHNHPSGQSLPSMADRQSAPNLTNFVREATGLPDLDVRHIVVGSGEATQFAGTAFDDVTFGTVPPAAWGERTNRGNDYIRTPESVRRVLGRIRTLPSTMALVGLDSQGYVAGVAGFSMAGLQPERQHEALLRMGAASAILVVHGDVLQEYSVRSILVREVVDVYAWNVGINYGGGLMPRATFEYLGGAPSVAAVPAGAFAVTRTPEFQRWFAGSKVVDEKGEPLVVYHGTSRGFSSFGNGWDYFSENRTFAEQYSHVGNAFPPPLAQLGGERTVRIKKPKWVGDTVTFEEVEVRAFETSVPGLVYAEVAPERIVPDPIAGEAGVSQDATVVEPASYSITHAASGLALGASFSSKTNYRDDARELERAQKNQETSGSRGRER